MIRPNIKKIATTAILIVLAILVAFVLSACKGQKASEMANVSATMAPNVSESAITEAPVEEIPEIEVPVAAEKEDIQIETPYCTLYYPGEWEAFLQVEQTEGELHTVEFITILESGKSQALFAVVFGGEEADAYGTIMTEAGESVPVRIECYDIVLDDSWTDNEANIVFTMQEALNDVLAALPLVQTEEEPYIENSADAVDSVLPPDNGEEMAVDTEHIELKFPARWEEYLTIEVDDEDVDSVAYYANVGEHDKLHLFTIYFGGEDGLSVQTITDANGEEVEIRIFISELEFDDSWSEDEQWIAIAMQEDLNYLLSSLG